MVIKGPGMSSDEELIGRFPTPLLYLESLHLYRAITPSTRFEMTGDLMRWYLAFAAVNDQPLTAGFAEKLAEVFMAGIKVG